jgi:hypothetical protein
MVCKFRPVLWQGFLPPAGAAALYKNAKRAQPEATIFHNFGIRTQTMTIDRRQPLEAN